MSVRTRWVTWIGYAVLSLVIGVALTYVAFILLLWEIPHRANPFAQVIGGISIAVLWPGIVLGASGDPAMLISGCLWAIILFVFVFLRREHKAHTRAYALNRRLRSTHGSRPH